MLALSGIGRKWSLPFQPAIRNTPPLPAGAGNGPVCHPGCRRRQVLPEHVDSANAGQGELNFNSAKGRMPLNLILRLFAIEQSSKTMNVCFLADQPSQACAPL